MALNILTVVQNTYKTMVLKIVTFTTADEAGVSHIGLGSPLKENKVTDHELSNKF